MQKQLLFIFFLFTGMALIAWVIISRYPPSSEFRLFIEYQAEQSLHRKLTIDGPIMLRFGDSIQVEVGDLRLDNRGEPGQLFQAKRVIVDLAFWPLFRGEIKIRKLWLQGARLNLFRENTGKWNIDDLLHTGKSSHIFFIPKDLNILKSIVDIHDPKHSLDGRFMIEGVSLKDAFASGGKMNLVASMQTGNETFHVLSKGWLKVAPSWKSLVFRTLNVVIEMPGGSLDFTVPSGRFESGGSLLLDAFNLHFIAPQDRIVSVLAGKTEFSAGKVNYAPIYINAGISGQTFKLTLPAHAGTYSSLFPVEFSYQAFKPVFIRVHGKGAMNIPDSTHVTGQVSVIFKIGSPEHSLDGSFAGKIGADFGLKTVNLDLSGHVAGSPAQLVSRWSGGKPWHLLLNGKIQQLDFADLPQGGGAKATCYWLSGQLKAERLIFNGLMVDHAILTFDPQQCAFFP